MPIASTRFGRSSRRKRSESKGRGRGKGGGQFENSVSFLRPHSPAAFAYGASVFSTAPVMNQPSFVATDDAAMGAKVASHRFELRQIRAIHSLLARFARFAVGFGR